MQDRVVIQVYHLFFGRDVCVLNAVLSFLKVKEMKILLEY